MVFRNYEEEKLEYGLSSSDVQDKIKKYGYNEIKGKKKISPVKIFIEQFNDFITWVLIFATVISGFMGERSNAITILIIIIMNSILGFIQEFRTEKSLDALKELASPTAKVIRDGKNIIIKSREIVIGDIVEIEAGDRIPADCIILKGDEIQSDESILTGESVPVSKEAYKKSTKISKKSMLYMGCIITKGEGICKVISTGMNTEMGKIANMLDKIEEESTPLQKGLIVSEEYLL